jgi:hypothetical protein
VHNERRQEGLRKFNAARTARHAAETKAAAAGNPTLKRHNPKTTRGNVGEAYHGCLRIEVRRSGDLYRRIEGWACAAMAGQTLSAAQVRPVI